MALRTIREYGDEVLERRCKEVKEVTPRIRELVEDMLETMYDANGVGLAAPQVGILKRIVVIDVSPEADDPIVMINPEILETSGEQTGYEGCLSIPGKSGVVTRPNYVKAKAFDLDMKEFVIEGEELLARAICHELDHLDGHMYVEKVEGELVDNEELMQEQDSEDKE
ncbi:peptide deformylase [Butyrivibrio sp.]|jgi:peptide deformylase|uniref:peptide deformylase n=1 Tax=Butyrivibrio sp. TaxID=28121 RepID=UPI0025B8F794|nr:peptide deformylase [Butyrivibrio sp.]MBE5839208.1 peptide deformylase [Butyrivibrio sp.]